MLLLRLAVLFSVCTLSVCTPSDDDYRGLLFKMCSIKREPEFPWDVVCVRGEACTSAGGELMSDNGMCRYAHGDVMIFTTLDQVKSTEYIGNLFDQGALPNFATQTSHTLADFEVEVYNTHNMQEQDIPTLFQNKMRWLSQQGTAFIVFGNRLRQVQRDVHNRVYFVKNMRNRTAIYRAISDMQHYNKLVIYNDLEDVNVSNLLEALDTKYPITDEEDAVAKCGNAAVEPDYDSLIDAFLTTTDYWFGHFWRFVNPVALDITASKIAAFELLQIFKDIMQRHFNFFDGVEKADLKDWHNLVCNAYVKHIEPETKERRKEATRSGLSETEQEYERTIKKYAGYWRVDTFAEKGLRGSFLATRGGFFDAETNLVLLGEKNKEHRYNSAEFWRRLLIAIVVEIMKYPHTPKFLAHLLLLVFFSFCVAMVFTWWCGALKKCMFGNAPQKPRAHNTRSGRS